MLLNAKKLAIGGLLLAMTEVCMVLGNIIETNTLFLLAAAAFFVGIVIREFGKAAGAVFYAASVLLGFVLSPNKLYVCSYAAMALYILLIELIWWGIGRIVICKNRMLRFWFAKFGVFNLIYVPTVLLFGDYFFEQSASPVFIWIIVLAGQLGWLLYDRAYEYVQSQIWSKFRGRLLR